MLVISLSISFILRYIFWNDIVEISSFENEKSISASTFEVSVEIEINILGERIPCLHEKERIRTEFGNCHSKILFYKKGLEFQNKHSKLIKYKIWMKINVEY